MFEFRSTTIPGSPVDSPMSTSKKLKVPSKQETLLTEEYYLTERFKFTTQMEQEKIPAKW